MSDIEDYNISDEYDYDIILKKTICKYGNIPQLLKFFEEIGELQQAICKPVSKFVYNGHFLTDAERDHIAEEIADVEIMLDQLKIMMDVKKRSAEIKNKKIEWLSEKIKMGGV